MPAAALAALTASTGTRHNLWNTPVEIVDKVVQFFDGPVELDPCSNDRNNPNIPCLRCFTEEDDGLAHQWNANSVFLNHPYSDSKNWIPYARRQFDEGNVEEMILLIKLDISTKWFRSIADRPWIAISKRLRFGDSKGAAPFQSALIYLGNNPGRFHSVFGDLGPMYVAIAP
jgi:phage N-6-adenine-methyltransferase